MANSSALSKLLAKYDYPLLPGMIAQEPASPRDSSKLLVYERTTQKVTITSFSRLHEFLPPGALLVFNDTKVIPARVRGTISTGGKADILCTSTKGHVFTGLCERRLETGEVLSLGRESRAKVLSKSGSEYTFLLTGQRTLRDIQRTHGTTPLPPYLKNSPLAESERRRKYQTIFARHEGSIAAPTASLHFTKRLLARLRKRHIKTARLTLHVNLGTFMPLTEEAVRSQALHEELFTVPAATQAAAAKSSYVIPVGTTALRALESMHSDRRSTRLFITEGYEFKTADGLITNFHVPKSSLMMLVAALVGREKLLELYSIARRNHFRFLSFGDAMLIL